MGRGGVGCSGAGRGLLAREVRTPLTVVLLLTLLALLVGPGVDAAQAAETTFSDVDTEHDFYVEIEWLVDQGVTTGWPDGTFRPTNGVTRQAIAAFFYRHAGKPEPQVTDEYVELDAEQREDLTLYDPESGELVFDRPLGELDIEPGAVLVSEPTEAAPNGMLVRVTSVSSEGDATVMDSEFAQLTDAIVHGQGTVSAELTAADVEEIEFLTDGVETTTATAPDEFQAASAGPTFSMSFEESVIDGVTVSGEAAIDLRIDAEMEFSWGSVDSYKIAAIAEQNGDLEIVASAGKKWKDSLDIAKVTLTPITFAVGPVPVVLTPEFTLTLEASGEIEASIETGVSTGFLAELGVEYISGQGLGPVAGNDTWFDYTPPTIAGSSNAQAGITPKIGIRLYETAGTSFKATGYGRAESQYPDPPAWSIYAGLKGSVVFDLKFPILGSVGKLDIEVFELEWLLAQADDEEPQPPPPTDEPQPPPPDAPRGPEAEYGGELDVPYQVVPVGTRMGLGGAQCPDTDYDVRWTFEYYDSDGYVIQDSSSVPVLSSDTDRWFRYRSTNTAYSVRVSCTIWEESGDDRLGSGDETRWFEPFVVTFTDPLQFFLSDTNLSPGDTVTVTGDACVPGGRLSVNVDSDGPDRGYDSAIVDVDEEGRWPPQKLTVPEGVESDTVAFTAQCWVSTPTDDWSSSKEEWLYSTRFVRQQITVK